MEYNRYHHGILREALLFAALEILAEQDEQEITLALSGQPAGRFQNCPLQAFHRQISFARSCGRKGFLSDEKHFRKKLESNIPEQAISSSID